MRRIRLAGVVAMAAMLMPGAYAERVDLQMVGQQGDHYFFTLPASHIKDQAYMTNVAKQFCSNKTFCYLGFWRAGKAVPKSFPLSDRQSREQIATYRQTSERGRRC
jgi:hypothetical protein